jgi:RHS repeat-associated protein
VNGDWTYTYDALNRLVTGSCNTTYACPPTTGVTYTYDRYGNRLTESGSGTGTWPDYIYNANNQVINNNSYDSAGNVINDGVGIGNAYTYDDENRMVTAANGYSASYVYDAFGHRVRTVYNGQNQDFLYDLNGKTIDQVTAGVLTRSEIYTPGGIHIGTYLNGTTYFDSSDWLGTSRVHTNASGTGVGSCTSMPFGEDLTCSGTDPSPIQFTGQEQDAGSGDAHFPFRYYSEVMGRWLTPDPAGMSAVDPTNPQTWNRYAYVMNNPLNYVDPLGLMCGDGPNSKPCENVPAPTSVGGTGGVSGALMVWLEEVGADAGLIEDASDLSGSLLDFVAYISPTAANNGSAPCLSRSALTKPEVWELNAASFYAQQFNTTVGFGIGASGATGVYPGLKPSVGGTLSSMLVADATGNTALVTTITYNSLNFGAGVQGGLQVSVGGGPITPGWSGSGSASGSLGAGLGVGVDITNTGAFTLNVGVGLGAKYSATMSNLNASYTLPICKQ